MWALVLAAWGLAGAVPAEPTRQLPRLYLEPVELPRGTGTITVTFDIPAGIQGWSYAACITDCGW